MSAPSETRVFFATELEGVATFWRIHRRDGVTLGFTSHDRDLWFEGVLHRAAPGILPSAIRRTSGLDGDSAEMQGALAHDSIRASDLSAGAFDQALVEIGAVDWENLDRATLYHGSIGNVAEEDGSFMADLLSAKAKLDRDVIPRTSPTCRARFCSPGCGLSAARFTHEVAVSAVDLEENSVRFDGVVSSNFAEGGLRWIDGPQAGERFAIAFASTGGFVLDRPLDQAIVPGTRAVLREGCDHTLATCGSRFSNAVNFQGEPFLPGNDLLAQYPVSQ